MLNALIFGAPGSGKGTYATRLKSKLGVNVIAMGDIFREIIKEKSSLGLKVKGYVEKGLLVPDNVVLEVLRDHLSKSRSKQGFILDGYPRTIEQAKALDKITNIDIIIELTVPDWIIIERLSTRRICRNCGQIYNILYLKPKKENVCDKCSGPLYQRADDTPDVIKKRIDVYEHQTQPLLEYYKEKNVRFLEFRCKVLDMDPDVAVSEIMKNLKKSNFA